MLGVLGHPLNTDQIMTHSSHSYTYPSDGSVPGQNTYARRNIPHRFYLKINKRAKDLLGAQQFVGIRVDGLATGRQTASESRMEIPGVHANGAQLMLEYKYYYRHE